MQAVYAYGGAMLFCEFMSEMRRPRDFLKGMIAAQAFIYVCYMLGSSCTAIKANMLLTLPTRASRPTPGNPLATC
jgi:hypothetical protein